MTAPKASICHKIPGRLRVKIPGKRGDVPYFSSVVQAFSEFPGLSQVEANPGTGSILFLHSSDPDAIVSHAGAKALFRIVEGNGSPIHVSVGVKEKFRALDEKIKSCTRGEWDVPAVAFFGLLGAGAYQIAKGNFAAPAWYTAFWYALNIFIKAEAGNGGSAG